MVISQNTWHFEVFKWWYEAKHGYPFESLSHNLCPYVRAILLWAPFRFLFSRPRIWATVPVSLSLFLLSVYEIWGKKGLLKVEAAVVFSLIVAIGVAMVFGTSIGIVYLKDYFNNNRNSPIVSFGTVLVEQTKAIHDKVCPIVTFE
jgi:hypothetical protein